MTEKIKYSHLLTKKWNNIIHSQSNQQYKKWQLLSIAYSNSLYSQSSYSGAIGAKSIYVYKSTNRDGVDYKRNTNPYTNIDIGNIINFLDDDNYKNNFLNDIALHIGTKYDYYNDPSYHTFWVNFANENLGGGVFGRGFVQEEIMCTEMPLLAGYIAKEKNYNFGSRPNAIKTRFVNNKSYSPRPIIIANLNRVIDITGYGHRDLDGKQINNLYNNIAIQKEINVLAMAAPDLKKFDSNIKNDRSKTFRDITCNRRGLTNNVIADLFHTFVCGFELIASTAQYQNKPILVNSGKIGSGDFRNDPILVAVLQYIATQYIGSIYGKEIRVSLWYYTNREVNDVNTLFTICMNKLTHKFYLSMESYTVSDILDIVKESYYEFIGCSGGSSSGASASGVGSSSMSGGNINYYQKYIKYKMKYLQLKNST
jgi:hypothetical protein